jgi:cyclophilin family peptidyl-prolyl cis-trans isomerase
MTTASPLHQPENAKEQAPAEYDVKFATTKGDFTIHVTRAWAPLGADRFYNLVKHGFYTDAHFFRAQGFAPFGQVTDGMDVVKNLHSGYGEGAPHGRGPDQGAITTQGKAYLDKNFPNLDSIKSATIQAAAGK